MHLSFALSLIPCTAVHIYCINIVLYVLSWNPSTSLHIQHPQIHVVIVGMVVGHYSYPCPIPF